MSSRLKLAGICFAAAFGLAACGGGGGGTADMTPDPTPPPTPPMVSAVAIPDAMYLDEDNAPMAGSMSIAAGDSYTNNGVTFSCPAGGDACEVEVMDDGTATSTGGEAMAALTDDAMVQVAQAKKDAADMAAAAAEELRDRIIGKDEAIELASNLSQTGAAADGTLDEDEIIITRGAGAAAAVRVTDPAGYTVSDEPAMPNGAWAGTHLTRAVAGATQHLFVYTDIEPPTRIDFYDWDGVVTTPALYTNPGTAAAPGALALSGAGLFTRGNLDPKFMSPGPPADGDVTQTFRVGASGSTSFNGNFNGAGGTYTCASTANTNCVVTISPSGTYTATTGTWTFTPEVNATGWRQDQEFMSFGWWMQEPNSANGTYTFQYYADGSTVYAPPSAIATGTATYSGRAAGKYAVQEIDDTGVTGGIAGQFTATATLNASFGSAANTISGSISGFQGEHPEASGWEVTLHRKSLGAQTALGTGTAAGFPAAAQTDPALPGYDGTTATIGDETAYGDWTGQYFGNAAAANSYPLGVGGTFQADNERVSIAGAFGARRPQ